LQQLAKSTDHSQPRGTEHIDSCATLDQIPCDLRLVTPQFFFRTTDVTGTTEVLGDVDMAMPGDGVKLGIRLGRPAALDDGARFAIREGGRTVGPGVVTKVVA